MEWLSNLAIRRPVTTLMFVLAMIVLGLVSVIGLPVELMPKFNYPVITIVTTYKGVAPEEMDELVAKPIEEAIESVSDIDKITSYSNEGETDVVIELKWGVNLDQKLNDIKDKITKKRRELPKDIDEPTVSKIDIMSSDTVLYLNLSGKNLDELKNIANNSLKPKIQRIQGVGQVNVYGGLDKDILLKINPYKLEAYNISMDNIINALNESSQNVVSGTLTDGDKEYLIRIMTKTKNIYDINNIVIYNKNGQSLKLSEVIDIILEDNVENRDSYSRINSEESISIVVGKNYEGNAISISNAIKLALPELQNSLPNGANLTISSDTSDYIKRSMNMVKESAFVGLILASLIVFLFLKNIKATLIISLAIPTSIIFTFVLMKSMGITLNLISLGGLALGVGRLVDDSIIVLENIYRHMTKYGKSPIDAARDGAKEIGLPILASTTSTILVFMPIVFMQGIASEIFRSFSYTVSFSLFASLIVSLTFVPMILSKTLKAGVEIDREGKFFKWIKSHYRKLLGFALKNRAKFIISTFALFFIIMFIGMKFVNIEFFPLMDRDQYAVSVTLPNGLEIEKANGIARSIEDIVKNNPYTVKYITNVTKGNISVNIDTIKKSKRKVGITDIMNTVRNEAIKIPDTKINVGTTRAGGGGSGAQIELNIFGDNYDILQSLSNDIINRMKKIDGIVDISSSYEDGSPEIRINLDREKIASYSLTVSYISSYISSQLMGITPFKMQTEDGQEINLNLKLNREYRDSIDKIRNFVIHLPQGGNIRLEQIGYISIERGPSQIIRQDRQKSILISANSNGVSLGLLTNKLKKELDSINFSNGYSYSFGGEQKQMMQAIGDLFLALIIAILLVYMVLCSQFESLVLPFIIMFTIPLALIGVYLGLLITRFNLSLTVMIGIIMLAGIVVSNAIVLLDYVRRLRDEYKIEKDEAIKTAGETRLRPILMTTATTIFGMLMMAFGIGAGADFYQPMAISVIFGLSFSTILTLVVIPVLYSIIDDWIYKSKENKK